MIRSTIFYSFIIGFVTNSVILVIIILMIFLW